MNDTENNPIFGVLCLPSLLPDPGFLALADLRQSSRLDGLLSSSAIEVKGFGRNLGRKFIRFLKSEGPLQDDP